MGRIAKKKEAPARYLQIEPSRRNAIKAPMKPARNQRVVKRDASSGGKSPCARKKVLGPLKSSKRWNEARFCVLGV